MLASHDEAESKSIDKALSSFAKEERKIAMKKEMELMNANIWDLVDLLQEQEAIGNKWILKIKRKIDGIIERYKVWLVAKYYIQ